MMLFHIIDKAGSFQKKKKVLLRCRLKKCIMDGNVRAKKSFKHRSIRVFVNMHHT